MAAGKRTTHWVLDEWKQVQKMCPLARTHLKSRAFVFFCSHGMAPQNINSSPKLVIDLLSFPIYF